MSALARRCALSLVALALLALAGAARALVEVPYLTGRVVDTAEILSPAAADSITALLREHEAQTSNQIAVLTLPNLAGESIEDFAQRVFDAWRLGQTGRDNGVLVVVASEDRRMRIHVGYGLEDPLTDLAAGRIIRNVMTPRFREGDYDGGVTEGVQAILATLTGQGEPPAEALADEAPAGESEPALFEGPDLSIIERIMLGAFIFGIIGLFTVIGIVTPSGGWILYPFLIPFWATFPIAVLGLKGAFILFIVYLVGFPTVKLLVSRASWYGKARKELKTKGTARIGGFTFGGSSSSSSGGSWSSGSSSFSGGGGSSGGGGASGSW